MTTYTVTAYREAAKSKWTIYLVSVDTENEAKEIVKRAEPEATRIDAKPLSADMQSSVLIPPGIPVYISNDDTFWMQPG